MKNILLKLFASLYNNEIDSATFLKQFQNKTGFLINEDFCIEQIREGIMKCDKAQVDLFIDAGFIVVFTKKSLITMCELLESSCHHKHEDIAMLLKEIADPNTVDCLYKTVLIKLDYLDYDDTYQLARKCIKAISRIGNENAINKLKMLTLAEIPEIAEYARKELDYKGLL